MSEDYNIDNNESVSEDLEFEKVLRPKQFLDFEGQEKIVDNLKVFIEAAKQKLEFIIIVVKRMK